MKRFQWLVILVFFQLAFLNCSLDMPANETDPITLNLQTDSLPATAICSGINELHLTGQFNPAKDTSFAIIPNQFTSKKQVFLRKEALDSFELMWNEAQDEGIDLTILSATRNWTYQRSIWNRKWNGTRYAEFDGSERAIEILKYSSMPGSSRHHWGTDVDLNALENEWFESDIVGVATYAWLKQHAGRFGFHQVYGDQKNGRTGYREEKWHWSYLPLAKPLLDCYLSSITTGDFQQFEGAQWADSIGIVELYVQGVDIPKP
ncbi:MAG: D-alanyl-D-alanine carboxypeptidase [Crocinitomicaceae bacterium]|nr:D-alanyl-D-alanine carboxypeptidase [Crocinitomicaceae bacterium]